MVYWPGACHNLSRLKHISPSRAYVTVTTLPEQQEVKKLGVESLSSLTITHSNLIYWQAMEKIV